MGYPNQRNFSLNQFHRVNCIRAKTDYQPEHDVLALVVCVQEEIGELAAACLGVTGEKQRKKHLTKADALDAVADAMTYLSLVAGKLGCGDLESLLGDTFNMVSERNGCKKLVPTNDKAERDWDEVLFNEEVLGKRV